MNFWNLQFDDIYQLILYAEYFRINELATVLTNFVSSKLTIQNFKRVYFNVYFDLSEQVIDFMKRYLKYRYTKIVSYRQQDFNEILELYEFAETNDIKLLIRDILNLLINKLKRTTAIPSTEIYNFYYFAVNHDLPELKKTIVDKLTLRLHGKRNGININTIREIFDFSVKNDLDQLQTTIVSFVIDRIHEKKPFKPRGIGLNGFLAVYKFAIDYGIDDLIHDIVRLLSIRFREIETDRLVKVYEHAIKAESGAVANEDIILSGAVLKHLETRKEKIALGNVDESNYSRDEIESDSKELEAEEIPGRF